MKKNWFLLGLMMILTMGLMVACGGGDDDDSGGGDDDTADDDVTDDDITDDDIVDDDTTDDDTTDDDTADDDTADDDVVYPPLFCQLPDPAGLGEGITVGGGAITDTIDVYVYDSATCDPINGATVIGGGDVETTGADGHAVLTLTKAATMVTAYMDGYWTWAYKADAQVMYFRLQGSPTITYNDSDFGTLKYNGTALPLENPSSGLTELLNGVYAGGAVPGISRASLLNYDLSNGLLTQGTFSLSYDVNIIGSDPISDAIDLPYNIYMPTLDYSFAIPLLVNVSVLGDNPQIKVPVATGTTEMPIEGVALGIVLKNVLDTEALIGIITALINGDDITQVLLDLLPGLLSDGISFPYVGANPTWGATGAPDIDMVPITAKAAINLTVGNPDADFDYLPILAAEIPNRALLPLSVKFLEGTTVALPYAEIPDANYVMVLGKTDLLTSGLTSINIGFALKFADDISEWSGGVTINDSEFLPMFDSVATNYNDTTGLVSWDLAGKATMDAVLVIYAPSCDNCPTVLALVPGSDTSYQAPAELGITPAVDDVVVLVGIDLPDGVDINNWDPTALLTYDSAAINMWTNYDLSGLFPSF